MSKYNRDIHFNLIKQNYAEAIRWRSLFRVRCPNAKIVLTNGCFDILHIGHVKMFSEAAKHGDCLVVLLNSDESVRKLKGRTRPFNKFQDRKDMLLALKDVDFVFEFKDKTCTSLLTCLEPHVYFKSSDYSLETLNPEERLVLEEMGTQIVFGKHVAGVSTTNIIKQCKKYS